MITTDLQKPFTDEQLKAWAKLGPLSFGSTIGFQAPRYRVLSHDGTITPVCVAWVDAELTCDPGKGWRVVSIPLQTKMVLSAPDLAARVLELEAENKRLRVANHKAFTDGMEAAAQICGSLAEVEYDDADGFEAATGCEAAIMRVVKEQCTEQARAALKGGE
jgi:hypothetical protein